MHSTLTTQIYQHPHLSHHLLFMFLGIDTQAHTDQYLIKRFSENRCSNVQKLIVHVLLSVPQ